MRECKHQRYEWVRFRAQCQLEAELEVRLDDMLEQVFTSLLSEERLRTDVLLPNVYRMTLIVNNRGWSKIGYLAVRTDDVGGSNVTVSMKTRAFQLLKQKTGLSSHPISLPTGPLETTVHIYI